MSKLSIKPNKTYYAIDAFYSYKKRQLHYIVKEVDNDTGESIKLTGYYKDPKYRLSLAPYSAKLDYIIPDSNRVEYLDLRYSEYSKLKRELKIAYSDANFEKIDKKLLFKYRSLFGRQFDIYDDYKIETKFLQREVFDYNEGYVANINIGYWDIEVYHDDTEFPDASKAKYPINSIAYYSDNSNSFTIFFLWNSSNHCDKDKLTQQTITKLQKEYGMSRDYEIILFDTERQLLHSYLLFLQDTDVLVGWNSIDFDTTYLFNRCVNLRLKSNFIDTFGEMYEVMNTVDSKKGMRVFTHYSSKILSLDYIQLIKFYSTKNYPSHSLNNIARDVLKDDKEISTKVEVNNLNIEYLTDPVNFINYNVGDVLLNKKIDDVFLFVKLLFKQKIMTRGFTASSLSINNILDSYISLMSRRSGLMCISPIKVSTVYTKKIWNIYKRINLLDDKRLKLIHKIREDNKTFSLFSSLSDLESHNYDVSDYSLSDITDNKIVMLSKSQYPFICESTKYAGAYVKSPKKGIYVNAVDFDATSMYPTSIYTLNISIDSWIYQIPENIALKYIYERESLIDYIKNLPSLKIEIYDVRNDTFIAVKGMDVISKLDKMYSNGLIMVETGAVFVPVTIKEGFFRKLIKYPIENRKKTKKEMLDLIELKGLKLNHPDILNLNITQLVLKIIANSVYGFLGFKNSRLFNVILASSVTLSSQMQIRYIGYHCNRLIDEATTKTNQNSDMEAIDDR